MKQLNAMELPRTQTAAECSAEPLPLVVFPRGPQGDSDERAASLRGCAERYLPRLGSILFRGFELHGDAEFRRFVQTFGASVTPLHAAAVSGLVGPGRLWVGYAGREAGETLIADNREFYANLSVALRTRLVQRGLRFVLTFRGRAEAGWRHVFQTEDRAQVEAFCRAQGTQFEWLPGDALRIERKGPLITRHPETGEPNWVDACPLLHHAWNDANSALAGPTFEVLYADGSRLETAVADEIVTAFMESAGRVEWEAGDVLLVDGAMISTRIPTAQRRGLRFATDTIAGFFRLS